MMNREGKCRLYSSFWMRVKASHKETRILNSWGKQWVSEPITFNPHKHNGIVPKDHHSLLPENSTRKKSNLNRLGPTVKRASLPRRIASTGR